MNDRQPEPVYAFPRLSTTDLWIIRFGGNGLGNLMFTWARCLVESERRDWKIIWPTWHSFKPKNWRVNPHDHRTYTRLFRPDERYISGWRKLLLLGRCPRIAEADALEKEPAPGCVVEFRGMKDMFAPFRDHHSLVSSELLRIARKPHLLAFSEARPAPVGIHVRRGDFLQRNAYQDIVSHHNSLLPLEWYIGALEAVRAKAGAQVPAFVFSDGTQEELAPLLTRPGVSRVDYGSGLGDMLGLSRSRLLIASGSTFSMWGSYLGQVPTIWHPKKLLQHLLIEHPEYEFEWTHGDSMPEWIPAVLGSP